MTSRQQLIKKLENFLEQIYDTIEKDEIPEAQMRSRTKNNIKYDPENRHWILGDRIVTKSAKTKGGAKELLKLAQMVRYLHTQLIANTTSTLREVYYQSLGWGSTYAMFETVNESNLMLEHLEVLLTEIRQSFGVIPEVSGRLYGPITIRERTKKGQIRTIDCRQDVNSGGYFLPTRFEDFEILSCTADFVLVIETGGLFNRLLEDEFDEKYNCLLVHTAGQPSRMVRRLVRELAQNWKKPVAIFTDGDVWGKLIAKGLSAGTIKSAHLSDQLTTPNAIHIGVHSSQIKEFNLPTDKITDLEAERLKEALKDPRFCEPEEVADIKLMLETKLKAEQQALARYGLRYASDVYLPKVLRHYGFLKDA